MRRRFGAVAVTTTSLPRVACAGRERSASRSRALPISCANPPAFAGSTSWRRGSAATPALAPSCPFPARRSRRWQSASNQRVQGGGRHRSRRRCASGDLDRVEDGEEPSISAAVVGSTALWIVGRPDCEGLLGKLLFTLTRHRRARVARSAPSRNPPLTAYAVASATRLAFGLRAECRFDRTRYAARSISAARSRGGVSVRVGSALDLHLRRAGPTELRWR